MVTVHPIRGIRLRPEIASLVFSNRKQSKYHCRVTSTFALVVQRSDIEIANAAFFEMLKQSWFCAEDTASLYVYRQSKNKKSYIGLIGAVSVEDYLHGRIKKHELTNIQKEDDLTSFVEQSVYSHEPVCLAYYARSEIDEIIEEVIRSAPDVELNTGEDVHHALWAIKSPTANELAKLFENMPSLFIADGHHRIAAASRHFRIRNQSEKHNTFNSQILSLLLPHHQLSILSYNRLVKKIWTKSDDDFLGEIRRFFYIKTIPENIVCDQSSIQMYFASCWYELRSKNVSKISSEAPSSVRANVSLQTNVFQTILGIQDCRSDARLHYINGTHGFEELKSLVDKKIFQFAFILPALLVEDFFHIVESGEILPPKSTWFEPKPLTGLIFHSPYVSRPREEFETAEQKN